MHACSCFKIIWYSKTFSTSNFLRTKNWTVHYKAWTFNHAYISIAWVNFNAACWKFLFYCIRFLFTNTIPNNIHTTKFKKLLYRESDLLDVGMVVQKARKQGTVLLQWGFIGFNNKQPTFAYKEAYLQNVGLLVNCRINITPL